MNIAQIKKRLKSSGLKMTLPRKKILDIFLQKDKAVTYSELLQLTDKQTGIDRVTIYRTLKTFEEISLVHRVFATDGNQYFTLSATMPEDTENATKQHLHFCCVTCKDVFCLDDQFAPTITLPKQYNVISLEMTITGICKKCTSK